MILAATLAVALAAADTSMNVRDLPIIELKAVHSTSNTLAIVLSGDGGWADIDQKVGQRLQSRGVDVVGLDMRDYLRKGHHNPESIGADISRIARRYVALWHQRDVAIVGYSRGADLAPFAAVNLGPDVRQRLVMIAMLTLLERASFVYHFSDLWRTTSGSGDAPILPQLEQLKQFKGISLFCIYGKEEKESLCRTAPPGLMTVIPREGKHHFDGNYDALGDIVYDEIEHTAR